MTSSLPVVRADRALLLMVIVLAATHRFAVADHALWFDEQASVFFSDQPLALLWSDWMMRETNPPLYYSVLRAWRWFVGSSDVAIRSLSITASVAALYLLFRVTRRVFGTRAGVIAAALTATSALNLYYAEQARSYIFVFCAVLVALDALISLLHNARDPAAERRALMRFALAASTAIYLHSTMVLFTPIALAALAAAAPQRYLRSARGMSVLAFTCAATLFISGWAIRQILVQALGDLDNISAINTVGLPEIAGYTLYTLFLTGSQTLFAHAIVAAAIMLATIAAIRGWARADTRFLVYLAGGAIFTFSLIGCVVPIFVPRTIYWISIIPTVLAAAALADIRGTVMRRLCTGAMSIALMIDTAELSGNLEQEDWNTVVDTVSAHPGAHLLVQGEAMALLADGVCRRRLTVTRCPYRIVAVIDPRDRFDTWADRLFAGPKTTVQELTALPSGQPVFLFRKAFAHSLPALLHNMGKGRGITASGPLFIGPLPAAALK